MSKNEILEFTSEVKMKTENAILMNVEGVTAWVPKSLIENIDLVDAAPIGSEVDLYIPEFFAYNKGFI